MIWWVLCIALSGFVGQEEENKLMTVDRMIELCREYGAEDRERRIKEVNDKIAKLEAYKKAKVNPRVESGLYVEQQKGKSDKYVAVFKDLKQKRENVKKLTQEVLEDKQMLANRLTLMIPLMDFDKLRPFGFPPGGKVQVEQVLSKTSFHGRFAPVNETPKMKFTSINTDLFVDDAFVSIDRPICVDGTASYTTVLGAKNTVYAWRGLTDEEWKQVLDAIKGSAPQKIKQVWVDATGNFRVEATLVSFDGEKVSLERTDGKVIELPMEKLSAEDQRLVGRILGFESL
jgi:hypothetical protein